MSVDERKTKEELTKTFKESIDKSYDMIRKSNEKRRETIITPKPILSYDEVAILIKHKLYNELPGSVNLGQCRDLALSIATELYELIEAERV